MSKKDKFETIEVEDVNLLPDLLDGNHRVIPIVTGGDEVVEEVEVPEIIPILTLRSSVLFPGAITPITVGRDKSISLVRAVNAEGGILGAVLQRESDVEDPAPDDMYKVGTAARIIKILEMPNGNLTVILNGLEKVEIREYRTLLPGPCHRTARYHARSEERRVRSPRGLDPRRGAQYHQRLAVDAQGGGVRH